MLCSLYPSVVDRRGCIVGVCIVTKLQVVPALLKQPGHKLYTAQYILGSHYYGILIVLYMSSLNAHVHSPSVAAVVQLIEVL